MKNFDMIKKIFSKKSKIILDKDQLNKNDKIIKVNKEIKKNNIVNKVKTFSSTNIAVNIKNFNFWYNKSTSKVKHVLHDINIPFYKKKVTALIGPSGCGKSTLLKSINRMNDLIHDSFAKGEIIIYDKNIYNYKKKDIIELRTYVGMVFQKANPFPMSIYENVAFGPKSHGIKDKNMLNLIVKESLQKAALWDEVKDILKESALGLSGGQMQRLCIARAIALQPKILLMDEPTSALDPVSTLKVEKLIKHLKKDFTIILVTHEMQQATRVSDYTAFFYNGNLIEFNQTKRIFLRPKEKKTEDYITGRFG